MNDHHEDEGWSLEMVALVLFGVVVLSSPFWLFLTAVSIIEAIRS